MVIEAATLAEGMAALAAGDPVLARLAATNGLPPLWRREPGFATAILFILEQQVSLASARAAFGRLRVAGGLQPDGFLSLSDDELRAIGFSRQKARYGRLLAAGLTEGAITLPAAGELTDGEARARLLAIVGVGPWTADCYLLFVLGSRDVWPAGDRALHMAMAEVLDLPEPPTTAEAAAIAERWRPWRSVAARMLWHEYLGGRAYVETSP